MAKRYRNPALRAFKVQRWNAWKRGIEWQFSYTEWVDWWGADLASRGKGRDRLMMCRKGDRGPYHPDNCYKGTPRQNTADAVNAMVRGQADRWQRHRAAGGACWLDGRREDHPKRRGIRTPAGDFPSLSLAAEHYGVTRQAIFHRLKHERGYEYLT